MPDLILASTSPYRRSLLERLGVPFRCVAPLIDEKDWKDAGLAPRELAPRLAEAKALSIAKQEPHATILGADQVVGIDGHAYGKPGGIDRAVEQLLALAGRSHELITSMAFWHAGKLLSHTDVTRLQMRSLTRAEAERYVAADDPIDCAGAYKIESRGIALFERIESADHTAITGLPLIAATRILRGLGFAIP
jgi:septum formation protein